MTFHKPKLIYTAFLLTGLLLLFSSFIIPDESKRNPPAKKLKFFVMVIKRTALEAIYSTGVDHIVLQTVNRSNDEENPGANGNRHKFRLVAYKPDGTSYTLIPDNT